MELADLVREPTLEEKLSQFKTSYDINHAIQDTLAKPFADVLPSECRYCGKYRGSWQGSKLDGHALCLVSPEFRHALAVAMRDPRLTYDLVAQTLGVPKTTVRAWYREAVKRGRP